MAVDRFTVNPNYVRRVVNREGDGLSRGSSAQYIDTAGVATPYYEVTVKEKPGHASDTTITHTGPGAGVPGGVGKSTDIQGFVSPTGNKLIIDNSFGADTITLQHHSGATILIDADGSIHMISSGKKGVGMVSPKGDATVFAKNHLILKADGKITLETDGDLDLNVGGAFSLHVKGDMHTYVEGSIEEFTDGSKVTEVVKDVSTTVAGDNRTTVAGNMQTQVSGNKTIDVGKNFTARSDANTSIFTQKFMKLMSKDDMSHDTKGNFTTKSEKEMVHETKKSFAVKATENIAVDAKGTMTTKVDGNVSHNTKGNYTSKATGATNIETKGALNVKSTGAMKLSASGTFDAHASGAANIKAPSVDINDGSPSPDSAGDPNSAGSTSDVAEAPLAQYAQPEIIIDNLSSVREAPDFPKNAKRMSKGEFSVYKNEGNQPNPKAEAAASPNQGAGAPPRISDGASLNPSASNSYDRPGGAGTGKAEKNPLPIPKSIYNTNEKISKHVTIGQVLGLRGVPAGQQRQVIIEAMNVAWNIIDPLIEKFGGRIQITSWWRSNSGNHVKGGAVDLRCSNKGDVQTTAEIAAYVRDNLPYSKILLEKNDSPGIHVHLESAQPGQPGGGTVITCADPQCRSSVDGIKLSYAVAALRGRSVG